MDARKRQSKEEKGGKEGAAATAAPGQGHSLLPFAPALLERKLEKVRVGMNVRVRIRSASSRRLTP